MIPKVPVRDIMRRTMFNLKFIEKEAKRKRKNRPYEVTQLVNSFLGALAHPWETFKKDLSSISIADAEAQDWPRVKKELPTDTDPKSLGDLLRLMRNGIAHGNIIFVPDSKNRISAVQLWNVDPKLKQRTWGTVLTIETMRDLLERFVELAEELHKRRGRAKG